MKRIEWVDASGYKRVSMVRDSDGPEMAEYGLRLEPPPVDMIDWDGVKRDLHNALTVRGIVAWESLMGLPGGVDIVSVIAGEVLAGRIKSLLRGGGS